MLKIRFLLFFMLLGTIVTWAQKQSVKGTVSDDAGEAIPGVTVMVKGTTKGTITDFDGNYTIEVPDANSILVYSFVGMAPQEIKVEDQSLINVALKADNVGLEEVVVVGYGVQSKKSSVASISQTEGEELLKSGNVTSVSGALQGMMPGVTAVVSNGKPGDEAADIYIRGKASWTDSDPLVLVDGVERDMNDVDPNEIETISVLKDGSATAVYGVLGANGVILVTTKRGRVSKPKISLSTNFGFKRPTAGPEFSNYVTAMEMWNEALANDKQWGDLIPESTINAWRNAFENGETGAYSDYYPDVDWWDTMVKDVGYQQSYNVNVRGGTNFVKYFVSLGYSNDGDIFETQDNEIYDPSFNYKKYNWRSNFDFDLTKSTRLSVNISGKLGYRNQTGYRIDGGYTEDGWGQAAFFKMLYTASENDFPIKYDDGEWGTSDTGAGNLITAFDKGQRTYKYYQGFIDFKLEQKLDIITKGLKFNGTVAYNSFSKYQTNIQAQSGGGFGQNAIEYFREYDYANPYADGTLPMINEVRWPSVTAQELPPSADYDNLMKGGFSKKLYYEAALNWARTFGDHNLTALALWSRREKEWLGDGSTTVFQIPHRQEDWVGRLTYNWRERYLVEVNGSINGSENFAPGMRFGEFSSGTLGWRISEEPWVKEHAGNIITNLKLKYSYGASGMDNGSNRFNYLQQYNTTGNVSFGSTSKTTYSPIYIEGDAANDEATWENAYKQNFGIEYTLWEKLTGSVDVYSEKRKNILMDLWSPLWFVQKEASANIGETKNHGTEIELGWRDKIGSDFRYRVKATYSFNENRIVERGDGVNTEEYQKQAGKPIGWQTSYIASDYYSSLDDIYNYSTPNNTTTQGQLIPGDFMYVDYDADGIIDSDDKVVADDLKYPLSTYGLTLGCGYKGWDLNVVFYGVSDVSKGLDAVILWDNWDGSNGIYKAGTEVLGRWTPETASTAVKPSLHSVNGSYSKQGSTYTYQDASYVRLKNVELSYTFRKSFLEGIGLSKLQIYGNGNNLITFTDLDDRMDPETSGSSVYPVLKRYNVGLRASF